MYHGAQAVLCDGIDPPNWATHMTASSDLSNSDFERQLRQAVRSPPAPQAWVHNAIQQWDHRAWKQQPASAAMGLHQIVQAAVQHLVAQLRFDSWAPQAGAMAVRSGRGIARHLVFSVPGCDVDVRVLPEGTAYRLSGQILGPEEGGYMEVLLQPGAGLVGSAALNELGEFRFDALPAGQYQLMLVQGQRRTELAPVVLGPYGDEPGVQARAKA